MEDGWTTEAGGIQVGRGAFKQEAMPGLRFPYFYSLWANIELTLLKTILERHQDMKVLI